MFGRLSGRPTAAAPRTVLALTTSFPRFRGDAAGGFVARWAQVLADHGCRVTVLAPHADWQPRGLCVRAYRPVGRVLSLAGAPEALADHPLALIPSALLTSASVMSHAVKGAQTHQILVGHWLVPCGLVSGLATWRRPGAHGVAYAHGSDVALLEGLAGGRVLARLMDRLLARMIFVSHDLRSRFNRLLPHAPRAHQQVLPMGIDPPDPDESALAAFRRRHRIGRARIVLTVGRLVPIKGLDLVARALAGRRDVVWVAAGEGPERHRIEHLCRQQGTALCAPGFLQPPLRDALLAAAEVVVLPSRPLEHRREGAPLALMEAIESGRPVVATRTGGTAEIARDAGVLLVPPNDLEALRAALTRVLDSADLSSRLVEMSAAHRGRLTWASVGPTHVAACGL